MSKTAAQNNLVTCPNCQHQFDVEESIGKKLREQFEQQLEAEKAKLAAQRAELEQSVTARAEQLAEGKRKEIEAQARQVAIAELEAKMKGLEEALEERKRKDKALNEQLALAEQQQQRAQAAANETAKQLAELQEKAERELKAAREAAEKAQQEAREQAQKQLETQLRLEREALEAEMRANERKRKAEWEEQVAEELKADKERLKREAEDRAKTEYQLQLADAYNQLDILKKQLEEANRKAQQGSMQAQGEVQELLIEEELSKAFPQDVVAEVKKGERGADCKLRVNAKLGIEMGQILIESKRAQNWSAEWVRKLNEDGQAKKIPLRVLVVTQALPPGYGGPMPVEGVWVCTLRDYLYVIRLLREQLIMQFKLKQTQQGQGTKQELLYEYFSGEEFENVMRALLEQYSLMMDQIEKERTAFEKQWKAREQSLELVRRNLLRFQGSVQGIIGTTGGTQALDDFFAGELT